MSHSIQRGALFADRIKLVGTCRKRHSNIFGTPWQDPGRSTHNEHESNCTDQRTLSWVLGIPHPVGLPHLAARDSKSSSNTSSSYLCWIFPATPVSWMGPKWTRCRLQLGIRVPRVGRTIWSSLIAGSRGPGHRKSHQFRTNPHLTRCYNFATSAFPRLGLHFAPE